MREMTKKYGDELTQKIATLTTDIVTAYVRSCVIPARHLPEFIADVGGALLAASSGVTTKPNVEAIPAISIRHSVTEDEIICLYCGKAFKSLKRHIRSHHNVTPEQYRAKWGLKPDYPMTAPSYAKTRSAMAKQIGLGRKRKSK